MLTFSVYYRPPTDQTVRYSCHITCTCSTYMYIHVHVYDCTNVSSMYNVGVLYGVVGFEAQLVCGAAEWRSGSVLGP